MVVIARTALCSLLSVALSASALTLPSSANASASHALALMAAEQMAPASVLDLDSEDPKAGAELTKALRKAFAARGMSGGQEMSFAEVKLTMGCENDDPKCLAGAGESLGVNRLIYGYLKKSGGDYKVELFVLDVGAGVIEAETSAPLTGADLSPKRINDTATEIVNGLFPEDEEGTGPDVIPSDDVVEPDDGEPVVEDEPTRTSPYVWGPYRPRPKWKWAGLGVGAGLAVAGLIGTIYTASQLRQPGGPLEQDLFNEAQASLTDGSTGNDIDPADGGDLCRLANEPPSKEEPGRVTNKKVAEVCQQIDGHKTMNWVSIGVLVVGGVMTVAFTTLLFVHKNEAAGTSAKRRRHKRQRRGLVRIDAGPTRNGFILGGTGRF